uniref:Transposase n=1 Tax=Haemonchus contortus TaxID=6289 RepID=A0A7I5E7M2_HAECO
MRFVKGDAWNFYIHANAERNPKFRAHRMKVRDAVNYAKKSGIRWAGHVMRYSDDRWTRAVTEWIPRNNKQTRGRQPKRWSDSYTKTLNEINALKRERFTGPSS